MSVFDDDIDTMLADLDPVTLVFGDISANALRDTWDAEVLPGTEKGVVVDVLALQIKTSAFPGLRIGSSVVVCEQDAGGAPIMPGTSYVVRDRQRPLQSADGLITHLLLARTS